MLLIRNEQSAVLALPGKQRLVEALVQDLARLFPGDPRLNDRAATHAAVEIAVDRAATYGVVGPREVSLYVFLAHELGPGFESAPGRRWMNKLLSDPSLPPSVRLDAIY